MWCSERETTKLEEGRRAIPGPASASAAAGRAAYGASAAPPQGRKRHSPGPSPAAHGANAGEGARWEELLPRLPEGAQLLWRALGDVRLLRRVLAAFGGRTLRIPVAVPPEGHALRERLGVATLTRLTRALGGTEVYVPTCGSLLSRLRQGEIIREFSRATGSGMSSVKAVAWLAERYSLSDRRIWQILKTTDSAPREAAVLLSLREEAEAWPPPPEEEA